LQARDETNQTRLATLAKESNYEPTENFLIVAVGQELEQGKVVCAIAIAIDQIEYFFRLEAEQSI
jgi:hypothetical protein